MSKTKKALSRDDRAKRNFYRLVLPAFIIFALVIIVPFFLGFYYSLTDWKSVTQTNLQFVGLKNFTESLADTRFQYSYFRVIQRCRSKHCFIWSCLTCIEQGEIKRHFPCRILYPKPNRGTCSWLYLAIHL